jgi:hypothetical protein
MTIDRDDLDPTPSRRPPDDATPMGRIEGRDRERYARLWGVDLDTAAGQEDFDTDCKMMWVEHAETEGVPGEPSYRAIDLEQFARAWRPMSESEYYEAEIERRKAAQRPRPRPN